MVRLSDQRLTWMKDHTESTTESEFQSVIDELQQLRAAKAADRERVAVCVKDAVLDQLQVWAYELDESTNELTDAIATRVADALAVAVRGEVVAEHDHDTLLWMRQKVSDSANQHRAGLAVSLLDRLLAAPDPIRTAIRALLSSDKTAGELRAALEELVR